VLPPSTVGDRPSILSCETLARQLTLIDEAELAVTYCYLDLTSIRPTLNDGSTHYEKPF